MHWNEFSVKKNKIQPRWQINGEMLIVNTYFSFNTKKNFARTLDYTLKNKSYFFGIDGSMMNLSVRWFLPVLVSSSWSE